MNARVLVIDNEPWMRSLLVDYLQNQGYQVQAGADMASARTLLEAFHPDMLILDVILPDGNGLDLLNEIKSTPRTQMLPVIMISAHRKDITDKLSSFHRGADDYLVKPFDMKEMGERIQSVMKKHRALQGERPELDDIPAGEPLRLVHPQLESTLKEIIDRREIPPDFVLQEWEEPVFRWKSIPGRVKSIFLQVWGWIRGTFSRFRRRS